MIDQNAFVGAVEEMIPDADDVADMALIVTYNNGDACSFVNMNVTHSKALSDELNALSLEISGMAAARH